MQIIIKLYIQAVLTSKYQDYSLLLFIRFFIIIIIIIIK